MTYETELRIGNYVQLALQDETHYEAVKLNKLQLIGILKGDMNFKPIELTKEWLMKLGFENVLFHGRAKYVLKESEYTQGWFYIKNTTVRKIKNLYAFRMGQKLGIVKYVHQLQNLYFSLIGQELTVKL